MHPKIFLAVLLIVGTASLVQASQPVLYTCVDSACSNCTATQNLSSTCLNTANANPFALKLNYLSYQFNCSGQSFNFFSDSACKSLLNLQTPTACVYDSVDALDVSFFCPPAVSAPLSNGYNANTFCSGGRNSSISQKYTSGSCGLASPGDFLYLQPVAYTVDCQSQTLSWYQDSTCKTSGTTTISLPFCLPGSNGNGFSYYTIKCPPLTNSLPSGNNATTNATTSSPSLHSAAFSSKPLFSSFSILSVVSLSWLY